MRIFAKNPWWLVAASACAPAFARGGSLPACTGTNFVLQEMQQTNCVVANPGGSQVVTSSFTNDPTYVNTPVTQALTNYQTTLTAILNGGATIFSETLDAPFGDPSVQSAILAADGLFTSDGAMFGSPLLTSNSTALQSSVVTYVVTSPTFDLAALLSCTSATGGASPFACSGVTITANPADAVTFGPAAIMIGPGLTDEFDVLSGQENINVNTDYTYIVNQNAVTTNTYLTTQSYAIDGTTSSAVPEPGTITLIGCALAILLLRCRRFFEKPTDSLLPPPRRVGGKSSMKFLAPALLAIPLTIGLARADSLPPCTGTGYGQLQQSNCVVANLGGPNIVTESYLNDPTFVNTPLSQVVNDYQTTLTAILNGGTTVYQQTFSVPFNAVSVQNAIAIADALLNGDGASFGAPVQTANSTALVSSVTSYVPTSPTLDLPTLFGCNITINTTASCDGVPVTYTFDLASAIVTFGPATIMLGAGDTDEYAIPAGVGDTNVNVIYSYVVDQNAIATNTYLTTQSYEIDGATNSTSTPEPGTLALIGCALAILTLRRRTWRIGGILAAAIGLAHGGNLPPCTGANSTIQETQTNCLVTNPGTPTIVTNSTTDDPAFVNTPVSQTIDDYQTTVTGLLNGGTGVYQQTFDLPFNAVSVQNAIAIVNAMLASDGASVGSPQLIANSTTLQSSVLSYVQTSPPCDPVATGTCPGVTITSAASDVVTFGPATIMTGAYDSDELIVLSGQEDINVNTDFMYPVDQNAVTTNTYLITQSYTIDGTTNTSSAPEPGTLALLGCALAVLALRRRTEKA
jgi:hypothetical protein